MRYEPNDKHKHPWQQGRRGSLCPREINLDEAQRLLEASVPDRKKRYATDGTRAYCAQMHFDDCWHGYPVGWEEVPPRVRAALVEKYAVDQRSVRHYWHGEPVR